MGESLKKARLGLACPVELRNFKKIRNKKDYLDELASAAFLSSAFFIFSLIIAASLQKNVKKRRMRCEKKGQALA